MHSQLSYSPVGQGIGNLHHHSCGMGSPSILFYGNICPLPHHLLWSEHPIIDAVIGSTNSWHLKELLDAPELDTEPPLDEIPKYLFYYENDGWSSISETSHQTIDELHAINQHGRFLVQYMKSVVVELGVGGSEKTEAILAALEADQQERVYVAVDINRQHVQQFDRVCEKYPRIHCLGFSGTFHEAKPLVQEILAVFGIREWTIVSLGSTLNDSPENMVSLFETWGATSLIIGQHRPPTDPHDHISYHGSEYDRFLLNALRGLDRMVGYLFFGRSYFTECDISSKPYSHAFRIVLPTGRVLSVFRSFKFTCDEMVAILHRASYGTKVILNEGSMSIYAAVRV